MKKTVLVVIALSCLAMPAMATWQRPDLIAYDGILCELHTPLPNKNLPLESLWPDRKDRPNLSEMPNGLASTGCYRGYVAIWQIEGNTLYLAGLNAWQGDKKADLNSLFPNRFKNGRVKADWFNGGLSLSIGRGKNVALVFKKGEVTLSPNKTPEHISEGRERPSENAQR